MIHQKNYNFYFKVISIILPLCDGFVMLMERGRERQRRTFTALRVMVWNGAFALLHPRTQYVQGDR